MAVTLTGTSAGNQGLFNRLGRIAKAIDVLNVSRDPATSGGWGEKIEAIFDYYDDASSELLNVVSPLTQSRLDGQDGLDDTATALRTAAEKTLIEMFKADDALQAYTLEAAIKALIKQMRTATTTYVDANVVAASVTQTGLTGTGKLVASATNGNGVAMQHLLADTYRVRVTGGTSGAETLSVTGMPAQIDTLAHDWPRGSGAVKTITSLDASASGNEVANGTFEDFTTNTPDDWTIAVGAAGAQVYEETGTKYLGASALKIAGDGSTLTKLQQTIAGLDAEIPYAVNLWVRTSATPAAGVLKIDLFDGSSVINDSAGTANSITVDLTAITAATWVNVSGVFRLPAAVPATVTLRLRLDTALENARNLFIDHLAMSAMDAVTAYGDTPWVKAFSGAVNWAATDGADDQANTFAVTTTNDRASQWQTWFERLFALSRKGLTLPTSGTTLINDSLIA